MGGLRFRIKGVDKKVFGFKRMVDISYSDLSFPASCGG